MGDDNLLDQVANYYSGKLAEHGQSAKGVDWNGEESQYLRFMQLGKVIEKGAPFSLNDLGCGYGALFDYLGSEFSDFAYNGIDISGDMVQAARQRYQGCANACFFQAAEPPSIADYSVASGIFNVRLDCPDAQWEAYIESTLDVLHRSSRLGFAFNCLTAYSDRDKMREYLYYANPCHLFDLCKRRYSRNVALLHDYNLYEFTIVVRKAA